MKIITLILLLVYFVYGQSVELTSKEKEFLSSHPTITVGMGAGWEPFAIKNQDGTISGFDADILDLINKYTGANFQLKILNWNETQEKIKDKSLDGLAGLIPTKEREEYLIFSKPYNTINQAFVTTSEKLKLFDGTSNLNNLRISIEKGNKVHQRIIESYNFVNIIYTDNYSDSFKKVIDNKADFAIAHNGLSYVLTKSGLPILYDTNKYHKSIELHYAFRKDLSQALTILQKGFDSISDEELKKLHSKWELEIPKSNKLQIVSSAVEKDFLEKHPTIKVSNDMNYAPYEFFEDGKPKGYSVDLLKLVSEKIGIKVEYINGYSWKELLSMFKEGKIDLLGSALYTTNREDYGIYSNSYLNTKDHFIIRKNDKDISSFKELTDKTIGAIKGWGNIEYIIKYAPNVKRKYYDDINELLNALSSKEIDTTTLSSTMFNYYKKYHYFDNLKLSNEIDELKDKNISYHFVALEKYPELISLINRTLNELTIDEIQTLNDKWFRSSTEGDKGLNQLSQEEKDYLKNKKVLNAHIEPAWIPYSYYENDEPMGFQYDIQKLIAEKLGLKLQVSKMYFSEAQKALENNELDIMLEGWDGMSTSKDIISSKKPLYPFVDTIVSKNNYKTLEELEGKKVGYFEGTEAYTVDKYPNINFVLYKESPKFFADLMKDEIDAGVKEIQTTEYFLKHYGISKYLHVNVFNIGNYMAYSYITVNKKNELLLSIIDKLVSQKEIDEIKQKWNFIKNDPNEATKLQLTSDEKSFLKDKTFNVHALQWEPFFMKNIDGIYDDGIGFEVFKELGKILGFKYTSTEEASATNMFKGLSEDSLGVILSTTYTKPRAEFGTFTKPYASFPIAIATNIDEDYLVDLKSLEGKSVAVGKDYSAHKLLLKNYPKIDFRAVNNTDEALKLLSKGEVYAAADILPTLIYKMNKHQYQNIKISGTSEFNFDVQILVNKDSEKLVPLLNKAIDSLGKDEIQGIVNKWLGRSYEITTVDYSLFYKILIPLIIIILIFVYLYFYQKKKNNTIEILNLQLNSQKNRYQNLVKFSSEGIFIIDLETAKLIEFSKAVENLLGYSSEELKKLYVYDWDKDIRTLENFKEIISHISYEPIEFERVHIRKDGSTYNAAITVSKILLEDKEYIYSSVRDISEKIELKQIKKLTEELTISQNIAKLGVAIIDDVKDFDKPIKCNDNYYDIQECNSNEVLTVNRLVSKSNLNEVEKLERGFKEFQETGYAFFEALEIESFKGNIKYIDIYWQKRSLENEQEIIYNIILDVTDKILAQKDKEYQSLLFQKQSRLALQGEMLSMIAHQWRQPLNQLSITVQSRIRMFKQKFGEYEILDDLKIKSMKIIENLSQTIEDFSRFYQPDKMKTKFKINSLYENLFVIIGNRFEKESVEVKINFNQLEDFELETYKNELSQVIVTMFSNSIEAFGLNIENRYINVNHKLENNHLVIEIEDNAGGIPEEIIDKVFDPYYSTKLEKNGTGLGLYMSKLIIEGSIGGELLLDSKDGKTKFTIVFPENIKE